MQDSHALTKADWYESPWTPQEEQAQNQLIGLDWNSISVAQAVALFEKIEATTYSPDFHKHIDELEVALELYEDFWIEAEPVHYFSPGIYMRELTIPAGTLLTGKIHNHDHLCVVSAGDIIVWSEGRGVDFIKAPATFKSYAGVRRIGYAKETTVWSTVHATNETDVDKLETLLYTLRPHQKEHYSKRQTK